jgi:hypothetical protein
MGEAMTVTGMIERLQEIEADGNGELHVLISDPNNGYGCGIMSDDAKYQIGHCDEEGYVWHSIDTEEGRSQGYELSLEPDVIMFF